MQRESVLELKQQVMDQLLQELHAGSVRSQAAGLPVPGLRLAIGYRPLAQRDFQLELRVQRQDGPAYQKALEIRDRARGEANIEIVQKVKTPTKKGTRESEPSTPLSGRLRPLSLGASISHIDGLAGSLGAFVTDEHGRAGILSNSHVIALCGNASKGSKVIQPGVPDKDGDITNQDEIALLSDWTNLTPARSVRVDAAYATVTDTELLSDNRIPESLQSNFTDRDLEPPPSTLEELETMLGEGRTVYKVGRTTGLTEGTVSAIALDGVPVEVITRGNVRFEGLIEVRWKSRDEPFSKPGDSGSVVFLGHNCTAIGLHFAAGEWTPPEVQQPRNGVSYSCNLATVLETLRLSWGL